MDASAARNSVDDAPADWKIGVDIGGTFIDFCALDARSGRLATLKVLTTPDDPGAELMTGLDILQEREGVDPACISRFFVHGTTVGSTRSSSARARISRSSPTPASRM